MGFFDGLLRLLGIKRQPDTTDSHDLKPRVELKPGADMSGAVQTGDSVRADHAVIEGDGEDRKVHLKGPGDGQD